MSNVQNFPSERALDFPRQRDTREYVWLATEGQPPERQRKLILEACAAGIINEQDRDVFLDAAGLGVVK